MLRKIGEGYKATAIGRRRSNVGPGPLSFSEYSIPHERYTGFWIEMVRELTRRFSCKTQLRNASHCPTHNDICSGGNIPKPGCFHWYYGILDLHFDRVCAPPHSAASSIALELSSLIKQIHLYQFISHQHCESYCVLSRQYSARGTSPRGRAVRVWGARCGHNSCLDHLDLEGQKASAEDLRAD